MNVCAVCVRAWAHARARVHVRVCMCVRLHLRLRARARACVRAYVCVRVHAYVRARCVNSNFGSSGGLCACAVGPQALLAARPARGPARPR